jgi:8-amino-7-oxononanoate synthase
VESIEAFLEERKSRGLLRFLRPITCRRQSRIKINGKEYLDFSSNDYLGLSQHPKLIKEIKRALGKFGTASCASRLLSGDTELHHELEEKIACLKCKEAALVFNSGYQANVGIISSLYGEGDAIFYDRLSHASIIDGIILSGTRHLRFRHNDLEHLKSLLEKERKKFSKALIVTETIFSMDGDRAPLRGLVELKQKYNCSLLVDEAHATGVFGKNGSGIVEEEGLQGEIELVMGTFSKALAGFGAYLAASHKIKDYLINTCRSFIYSTALPPEVIAGNLASLKLVEDEPMRREKLLESAEYFRRELEGRGFKVRSGSQIVPLIIGENQRTIEYSRLLQNRGYWVLPIRYPTVPKEEARLRFSLTSNHTKEILSKLIRDIDECGIQVY